jgi:hypothetical protein
MSVIYPGSQPLTNDEISEIRKFLEEIEKMLRNPTVVISLSRGIRYWNDYREGIVKAAPTEGRTVTIAINGGAQEERESHDDLILRIMREEGGG